MLIIFAVLAAIALGLFLPAWLLTFFVPWGFWKAVLAVITARLILATGSVSK